MNGCQGKRNSRAYHVVAVNMHGMYGNIEVIKDQADTFVVAEIVDVPFRVIRIGVVFLVREEKERIVEVGAESLVVKEKDVMAGGVRFEIELKHLCDCRDGWRCNGIEGYCLSKVIL